MYAEERQSKIVELVLARGRMSVADLAQEFQVTNETIRRDLKVLERMRLIRRLHGGAIPISSLPAIESGLDERDHSRAKEKERIALKATAFLPEAGGTLAVDAGSTTAKLVEFIAPDTHLAIFTHGVPIAARLATVPGLDLHLLPGKVRTTTQAAVGAVTVQAISKLKLDVVFLGTNGVSVENGLSTPDPEEAAVKRALVKCARKVIVLADSSKLGLTATVGFAELDEIDIIITDAESPVLPIKVLEDYGIEVLIA